MDGDINVDQTVVTYVKVRKPSDIIRMPPSNYRLCVKPHPSLSNEVKREITEKINNFFPNIGIYSSENEGDLGLIQSGRICVIICTQDDIQHAPAAGRIELGKEN